LPEEVFTVKYYFYGYLDLQVLTTSKFCLMKLLFAQVSGFPVNVPFVDLPTIVEAVYSTGVHSQETSNIEFALAVYVHGYANSVMSIWIYVASLVRLR
jgi:coiled-coil and C2 domain-containing protein 2A